jgi:hypothetical protein
MVALGCPASTTQPQQPDAGATGGVGGAGSGGFMSAGGGGSVVCQCAPGEHNDVIYALSDEAEIWSYDPALDTMSYVTTLLCEGSTQPYSMAVDHRGVAWVLFASNDLVFNVDLVGGGACEVATYTPHQTTFDLFGLGFSGPENTCPSLYAHSFSGAGSFTEGLGVGTLAEIDTGTGMLTALSSIDYDGGELAGTSDGRLFAFAGVNPAKLVEYDRSNGSMLTTTPLDGLAKTAASAFAFIEGDFYFFTEAWSPTCESCLNTNCSAEYASCQADAACAAMLQCAIDLGDIADDCGGLMPQGMIDCLVDDCTSDCLLPTSARVSQVTRYDADNSDGGGLSVVLPSAAIRVVGAANSTCVSLLPK